jgi:FtsP/CotA-like multicopper oxidase with cupredoxin domain
MFDNIASGTGVEPEYKNDIVTPSQGDRGILEFKPEFSGKYIFHAHQTEFTDLGWMGFLA